MNFYRKQTLDRPLSCLPFLTNPSQTIYILFPYSLPLFKGILQIFQISSPIYLLIECTLIKIYNYFTFKNNNLLIEMDIHVI